MNVFHHRPLSLSQCCELWGLTSAELLTKTDRATLYRVCRESEELVLKLFNESGLKDESPGLCYLKIMTGLGTVRLIDNQQNAALLEFLPGPSLRDLVVGGQDDEATAILGKIICQIHAKSGADGSSLRPLSSWFRALFERPKTTWDLKLARGEEIARAFLEDASMNVPLHGDIHHENVRRGKEGEWCLIDPKGLFGNPAYDVGNIFFNPYDIPETIGVGSRFLRQVAILSETSGIERQQVIGGAYAYACLNASWSIEARGVPTRHSLRMMEIIGPHISRAF